MQRKVLEISPRPRSSIYRAFTVFYASKTGGPVLQGEASWRDINGCMLYIGNKKVIFTFRRRGIKNAA